MREAYGDANVIVCFLSDQLSSLAEESARLFREVAGGRLRVRVCTITPAEVVSVMASYFRRSLPEVAEVVAEPIIQDGIEAEEQEVLLVALALCREHDLDVAHALLAAKMPAGSCRAIHSFDRHFDRFAGVERLWPGASNL
ncbi:MAG: type II toxin-antitoxin system VapC family toxin [Anaerolineae bacterium]|nr:type II toxin-antitoxin system VapC family toxin [Anaerolineae bacterium]